MEKNSKQWIVVREARVRLFTLVDADTGSKAISIARKLPDSEFEVDIRFINWLWSVRRYQPADRHEKFKNLIIDKLIKQKEVKNGEEKELATNQG